MFDHSTASIRVLNEVARVLDVAAGHDCTIDQIRYGVLTSIDIEAKALGVSADIRDLLREAVSDLVWEIDQPQFG